MKEAPPTKQTDDLLRAIEKIDVRDHLGLIYNNRKEQFAAIIPFIRIGLERGEKCIYVADENPAEEVLEAMRMGGINTKKYLKSGALSVVSKRETYLKNGYFDPDEMIAFLKVSTVKAKKQGYKALRVTGEMTWMLGGEKGTERLIEYEAKLNRFFQKNDCLAICQYNRKRFSHNILVEVIHTHPTVVTGDTVCKNFYFIPAEEFLEVKKHPAKELERLLTNLTDREHIESKLRENRAMSEESMKKYRGIFEDSLDGIFVISPEGKFLDINKKGVDLFGYRSKKEMLKLDISRDIYVNPLDRIRVLKSVNKQGPAEHELAVKKRSGKIINILCAISPIRDVGGKIISYHSIVRDITEHKKLEEDLVQFLKFFNLSTDIMVIADPNGAFKKVNPACLKILGYSAKELLSKPFIEFIHSEDKQATLNEMARQIKVGSSLNFENRYLCKNGKVLWLSWRANFNKNEGMTYATARDITQNKRDQSELTRMNRALRMLSQTNQTLIHATDEKKLLEAVSQIIVKTGGYRLMWIGFAEQDIAKTVRPMVQAGFSSRYLSSAKITWADNKHGRGPTGTAIRTGQIQIVRNILTDPKMVLWRTAAIKRGYKSSIALPLINEGKTFGTLNLYACEFDAFSKKEVEILEELSNELAFGIATLHMRSKVEERTREVDQLKTKFIQIVAHQLRTPLNVIRWNLEALLNRERGEVSTAQVETLRGAYGANIEIISRIGDLLAAIEIEEGQVHLDLDAVNIKEIFQSVCEEKRQTCQLKKIVYKIIAPKTLLPLIQADGVKIRSVIARLMDNAISYTNDKKSVTVKFFAKDGKIHFEVKDTGMGIPESEKSHIFDRFHRGWNAAQMKPDASGLGLFIAKSFVKAHHGEIGFSSKEKKGSTFWFELPYIL